MDDCWTGFDCSVGLDCFGFCDCGSFFDGLVTDDCWVVVVFWIGGKFVFVVCLVDVWDGVVCLDGCELSCGVGLEFRV